MAVTLCLASACASDNYGHLLTPTLVKTNVVQQVQTVLQTNTIVQTNLVTVTNGVFATNLVNEVVPVTVTNTVTVTNQATFTNWTVSSTTSNILAGATVANSLSSPINPYSGLIGLVLAGAGTGLAWFARLKSQQAAQHLSTASTIITAIEGLAPAVSAGVKTAVAQEALKSGTTNELNATVQAVVSNLPATVGAT